MVFVFNSFLSTQDTQKKHKARKYQKQKRIFKVPSSEKKKKAMDVIKSQQISSKPIEKVIVHPLVLLSIVDNYNRVAKDTRRRVVGVLLGSTFKGTVDVTNSYAGPKSLFYIYIYICLPPQFPNFVFRSNESCRF